MGLIIYDSLLVTPEMVINNNKIWQSSLIVAQLSTCMITVCIFLPNNTIHIHVPDVGA